MTMRTKSKMPPTIPPTMAPVAPELLEPWLSPTADVVVEVVVTTTNEDGMAAKTCALDVNERPLLIAVCKEGIE
jgi:hypothetical protein